MLFNDKYEHFTHNYVLFAGKYERFTHKYMQSANKKVQKAYSNLKKEDTNP